MRHIVAKILHQSKYDGFIRFIDGNRMNYYRKNIEPITLKQAIKSIGTKDITDWDANLNSTERLNVLLKRDDFDDTLVNILAQRGEFVAIKCMGLQLNSTIIPPEAKNYKCLENCDQICNKKLVKLHAKTCNSDMFLL